MSEEKQDEKLTPEESIIEAVGKPGLPALLDTAEAALDLVLDEGFLKELPLIGTVASLFAIGRNLRERLFLKKLLAFLREVNEVKQEERQAFAHLLESDRRRATKVGESLLLLLERLGETQKAILLGKFFAAYLKGQIDLKTFEQLGWALDRFFLQDIEGLKTLYAKNFPEQEVGARLANAGLAAGSIIVPSGGAGWMSYYINDLGRKFVELGSFGESAPNPGPQADGNHASRGSTA